MTRVISIAALKGGVGKTTTALNLGVCLHRTGRRVLVVDTDSQRSLRRWAERAEVNPTTPGATDTWSLGDTLELLEDVRSLRREILARLRLNRAERTALTKATEGAIHGSDVQAMATILHARVVYGEATTGGTGIVDYAPDSDAAREIRRLTNEVVEVLNG